MHFGGHLLTTEYIRRRPCVLVYGDLDMQGVLACLVGYTVKWRLTSHSSRRLRRGLTQGVRPHVEDLRNCCVSSAPAGAVR